MKIDPDMADLFGSLAKTVEKRTGRKIAVPAGDDAKPTVEAPAELVRLRIGNGNSGIMAFTDVWMDGKIAIKGTVLAPMEVAEFQVPLHVAEWMKRACDNSWLAVVIGPPTRARPRSNEP